MSNLPNILFNPPEKDVWGDLYGKKLLVAFSGGKDSLALLYYLWQYKETGKWQLAACHINHHLRGEESFRDENFCHEWCLKYGIEFIKIGVDLYNKDKHFLGRGIEYAARTARYDLLEEVRLKRGYDYILTAHTSDDQLESFFIDLITGASIATLGGIGVNPELNPQLRRPFLDISTLMVKEYLKSNKLIAIYDSTNSELNYIRNFVRHQVIPAFGEHGFSIQNTVRRLQKESADYRRWMEERTARAVDILPEGGIKISRQIFDRFSWMEKSYLIGKWVSLCCRGGQVHSQAILEQLPKGKSSRVNLPQRHIGEITPRNIRLYPAILIAEFERVVEMETVGLEDGRQVKLPLEIIQNSLKIRNRRPGDRADGKKLKTLFENRKFDPYERDRAVIVELNGEIIWVESLPETQKVTVEVMTKRK